MMEGTSLNHDPWMVCGPSWMNSTPGLLYMFKFIAPMSRIDELKSLFGGKPFTTRFSRTGKYVSVTAEWELASSEEVISYYREAGKIRGLSPCRS